MKLHIYIAALFALMAISHAEIMIPAGTCQNFTLFNETDNSTLNQSICAENATVIQNITIVQNITNVTNVTVQECNATTSTLWANSTGTFNNATITCLANITTVVVNSTIIQNQSVCNLIGDIYPNSSDQRWQNVSGLDLTFHAIPTNYCYENVNINPLAYQSVYRSDRCNITIVAPANQTPASQCLPYQYYTPCVVPPGGTCPSTECPSQNATTTQDCTLLVTQAREEAANGSAAEINSLRQEKLGISNNLNLCQIKAEIGKNATSEGMALAENAFDDKMYFVPYVIAAFIGVCMVFIAKLLYDAYTQNRDEPGEKYREAIGKEQMNDYSAAGKEKNVFEIGGKT